jgi:hypothetical protein
MYSDGGFFGPALSATASTFSTIVNIVTGLHLYT